MKLQWLTNPVNLNVFTVFTEKIDEETNPFNLSMFTVSNEKGPSERIMGWDLNERYPKV